jgi:preprotein translocase subunit SecE
LAGAEMATAAEIGKKISMAKSETVSTAKVGVLGHAVESVKAVPRNISSFYNDVRTEMKKVTSPSRKEVQATTTVVIITVAIFGVYFWVVDNIVGKSLAYLYGHLGGR